MSSKQKRQGKLHGAAKEKPVEIGFLKAQREGNEGAEIKISAPVVLGPGQEDQVLVDPVTPEERPCPVYRGGWW